MNPDLEPTLVDLAREADFSLGPLRVRPSLRQVESGSNAETLEPRVMQVLVALAQRQGEVVSRDELVMRCWDGRVVGEDAISRAIARVRRLSEAHQAFTLETIPRVGYRLVPANDSASDAAAAAAAVAKSPATAPVWMRMPVVAAALIVALVVVVLVLANRPAAGPDVDAVVARLTGTLGDRASKRDIDQVGAAAKELGASGQVKEKSAFAALANGDSNGAIEILEALAAEREAKGDAQGAADVYTRVGSLALVVDQGRGLAARQKAFKLAPNSLLAFQGLYFDTTLLKGFAEAMTLAEDVLASRTLTPRMRAWVLSHRGVSEAGGMLDLEEARLTLAEIKTNAAETRDPVAEASSVWLETLIALHLDDLRAARPLAERLVQMWPSLPEKLSNSGEAVMVRVLYAQGDWASSFDLGLEALDRRGRTGDFLPSPMIKIVCEAGILIGRVEDAASACRSLTERSDTSYGAGAKAYSGLYAAAIGDAKLASSELAAAHAMLPAGSLLEIQIMQYEAWAALKAGDVDEGERLVAKLVKLSADMDPDNRYRSDRANALRMLGSGLISAGKLSRACAPLAEAGQLYAEVGGDAGRAAVDALRGAAACR